MARAYECDRCGRVETGEPSVYVHLHEPASAGMGPGIFEGDTGLELCADCYGYIEEELGMV